MDCDNYHVNSGVILPSDLLYSLNNIDPLNTVKNKGLNAQKGDFQRIYPLCHFKKEQICQIKKSARR